MVHGKSPLLLSILILAGCSSVAVRWDFEGGSLGRVERIGETSFRCAVAGQADREGRNRQASWYYFRVDGAGGRDVTVTLTDLVGEYDYKPGAQAITGDTVPLWSRDGIRWSHFDAIAYDKDKKELTLRFTPDGDRFWVAHVEPYTTADLRELLDALRIRPSAQVETVGKTVRGRDLALVTLTNPQSSDAGKKVVWLMFRQHAWETGTSFAGEGLVKYLASDEEEARRLRDRIIFKVFPMMDPDGCAEGGVRFNRNGYDVNRNWDTVDVGGEEHRRIMPEIWHAKKAIQEWQDAGRPIHLFVTFHNQEVGDWLSGSEEFKGVAARFFGNLKEMTTFNPSTDGPRPPRRDPPAAGRYTVYEYLDLKRRIPAFIIEQGVAFNSRLGRLPTSQDRLEFGRRLAGAIARTVLAE